MHTHQEDTEILNVYAPNLRASKYVKVSLLQFKSHSDLHTLIVGDLNMPLFLKTNKNRVNHIETRQRNDGTHEWYKPNDGVH